jgi:O-antigen/teichoic acid export membrane protein
MQALAPHKNLAAINGPWIVIGCAALVGALNYANSIALSRNMNPSDYGAYATFTSLFLILGLVPNALQQQAAFEVARGQSQSNDSRNIQARPIIFSSLICAVVCLILAPMISSWLHLPTIWLLGLAAVAPVACVLGVMRGIAQGSDRGAHLGLNWLLEHGSKIVLTVILWTLGGLFAAVTGLFAAVTGLLVSVLIAALAMHFVNERQPIRFDSSSNNSTGPSLLGAAGLAQLAQTVIAHSDVLLAQAFLPRVDAGIYVAINVALRSISMLAMAINTAMFAKLVQDGPTRQTVLVSSLPVMIGLGLIGLGLIAPQTLIVNVLGEHYRPGAAWLIPATLAATLAATSGIFLNIRLARGKAGSSLILAFGAVAQVALILAFHGNALEVSSAGAGAMLITTLALTALHFTSNLKPKETHHVLQRL